MRKFVAEWMTGLNDLEEPVYDSATCASLETAKSVSLKMSKAAAACDWALVSEYEWMGDKRSGMWMLRAKFVLTWDGNEEVEIVA